MDELRFWLSELAQAEATGTAERIHEAEAGIVQSMEKRRWDA